MKNYTELSKISVKINSKIKEIAIKLENGLGDINGIVIVTDEEKRVIGCISDGDFRRYFIKNSFNFESATASELMIRNPICFKKSNSLESILDEIPNKLITNSRNSDSNLKYIFLTDENSCFIGIVDILKYKNPKKEIAVIGLGYVGLTLSLILSENKFLVSGIENNKEIVKNLSNYISHVREPQIEELLTRHLHKNFHLKTTLKSSYETYIISVGTPILKGKKNKLDESHLLKVLDSISQTISSGSLIILRSTVPIGTTRNLVIPRIENNTGLTCGVDFFVSFAPERTEEGNALKELVSLPQIIGAYDKISLDKTKLIFEKITNNIVVLDSLEEAEMIKLINNSFRDYVFAFSNQISMIANEFNLDIIKVIKSANYKYPRNPIPFPSPGVGGPCLTKDPYIFENSTNIKTPLFLTSRIINEEMPQYIYKIVFERLKLLNKNIEKSKIFCCGLAFKGSPKTGDLRNSTAVEIHNLFAKKSNNIYGFDFEANKNEISDLGIKFQSINDGFINCDAVLFLNNHISFKDLNLNELSRLSKDKLLIVDCWDIFEHKALNTNMRYSNLSKIFS